MGSRAQTAVTKPTIADTNTTTIWAMPASTKGTSRWCVRCATRIGRGPDVTRSKAHQPDIPVAGFYAMKLVRGGVLVPVRVWFGSSFDPADGTWCDRSHCWRACVDGEQVSIWKAWPYCSGRPISEAEYRHMRSMSAHATEHETWMPEAQPMKRIDLSSLPPIYRRQKNG